MAYILKPKRIGISHTGIFGIEYSGEPIIRMTIVPKKAVPKLSREACALTQETGSLVHAILDRSITAVEKTHEYYLNPKGISARAIPGDTQWNLLGEYDPKTISKDLKLFFALYSTWNHGKKFGDNSSSATTTLTREHGKFDLGTKISVYLDNNKILDLDRLTDALQARGFVVPRDSEGKPVAAIVDCVPDMTSDLIFNMLTWEKDGKPVEDVKRLKMYGKKANDYITRFEGVTELVNRLAVK